MLFSSVVVSQWTKMLEIVAVHLREAGISHDFIQGSVTAKKRSELVEEFNHKKRGPDVRKLLPCLVLSCAQRSSGVHNIWHEWVKKVCREFQYLPCV